MGLQTNLIRRGATYAWRRRLPAQLGGKLMQISLRTNDPDIAKRIAPVVTSESWHMYRAMMLHTLTKDDVRTLLTAVIQRELHRIELERLTGVDNPCPLSWEDDRSHDWATGKALQLLASRGVSGRELSDADLAELRAEGRSDKDIARLKHVLETEAQKFSHPPLQGPNAPLKQLMSESLGREDFSNLEALQGRKLYLQGRSAGRLTSLTTDPSFDQAMELAQELATTEAELPRREYTPISTPNPSPSPTPHVTRVAPIQPPSPSPYDPQLFALIERLMEQKRRQNVSGQMIEQISKTLALFVEAIEIDTIHELRQSHVAKYVDVLHQLPKHYRRSPKTQKMSLSQILMAAKKSGQADGLSVTTINRNLDYLGQLLRKAKAEGFTEPNAIDLDALRLRKKTRERDECPPFSQQDVQHIFQHPVWAGAASKRDWQTPGTHLVKDALFWVPLIASLTGARRAEIAGLKIVDVDILDGIPAIRIRENANRSIKTFGSERDVPLHPQLMELGFLHHVEALRQRGETDLFPDIRPKDGTKERWGGKLDYRFRKVLDSQLRTGRDGKSIKSFRHYVITELGRNREVPENVRKDIVGHVGGSITAERYTDTATLQEKLAAISTLPRINVKLSA